MLILVSPKKLMLSDDLYETRAGAYVFPDDVPDSAIQCAVRLPERTVAFWGKAWRTMDCDLAYALYNQELSKFIKNHFGFATNDGAKITESKREVPDRTIDMGEKEADDNDDEPRQAPPTKAEYEKDNPNPSYTEGEGQPSAKVWKPCNNCGAETWKIEDFCLSCGADINSSKEKGNLRDAGKKLKELLEPIVVKITRGGRSMAGIEKRISRSMSKDRSSLATPLSRIASRKRPLSFSDGRARLGRSNDSHHRQRCPKSS